MLVLSEMNAERTRLHLLSYTFKKEEFKILESVLEKAGIKPVFSTIEPDESGREGKRYDIPASSIAILGSTLGGSFDENGAFNAGALSPGQTYACREKKMGGRNGSGCKEFAAADDAAGSVYLTKQLSGRIFVADKDCCHETRYYE